MRQNRDYRAASIGIFAGVGCIAVIGFLVGPGLGVVALVIGIIVGLCLFGVIAAVAAFSRDDTKANKTPSDPVTSLTVSASELQKTTDLGSGKPSPRTPPSTKNRTTSTSLRVESTEFARLEAPVATPQLVTSIDSQHDNYEGYPPDWEARKAKVRERDKGICQVMGCICRSPLDVHHRKPIGGGAQPDHTLENLVILCRFHHAMLPNHNGIRHLRNDRYKLVGSHWRQGRQGRVRVKTRVRRMKAGLVTESSIRSLIKELQDNNGAHCKYCKDPGTWEVQIDNDRKRILVGCRGCWHTWMYKRGLLEEIGPQLFNTLLVATTNQGTFSFNLTDLRTREPIKARLCETCKADGRFSPMFKKKKQNGDYFFACEQWTQERDCQGDNWLPTDTNKAWPQPAYSRWGAQYKKVL